MKSFYCCTILSKQKIQENHGNYERFDLDQSMNSAECRAEFRVEKQDLPRLVAALQLPPVLRCEQRSICEDKERLCMLLKRVAYPCRLSDLIPRFARSVSVISQSDHKWCDRLHLWRSWAPYNLTQWNQDLLNHGALQRYADGALLDNCFGFVDGTVRPISRSDEHQRIVYNGHKRVHVLKFQSLSLPNGIIENLYGPVGEFFLRKFFLLFLVM